MANELNTETLDVALKTIDECAPRDLPDSLLIDVDERDELPEETERRMPSGEGLGIRLPFVPYEYGGMGGLAFDVYRVCERMAAIYLGLAASELATLLGSDPIRVGGTDEQKRTYMGRIAKDGILFAYSATEPEAGSDLGALKTTAKRVGESGNVTGHRVSGAKQWISNGGVADACTILAMAPDGPSWFVVGAGIEGFTHGNPEDKHGISPSKTAALLLSDVYGYADRLIGGVEGQDLVKAEQVFGYARLMVAAFGLGAAWAALERAMTYSKKRIQAGSPLSEKADYTHKLIIPHAIALEASRAAIGETAERPDADLKTGGDCYHARVRELASLHVQHPGVSADIAALANHALADLMERCRVQKLTRDQHILMRLRALIAQVEGAAALARRAQRVATKQLTRRHPGASAQSCSPICRRSPTRSAPCKRARST